MNNMKKRMGSFTLIELLIVVVIIGILAGVVVVNLRDTPETVRKEATRASAQRIKSAIKLFELKVGRLPSSLEELVKTGDENWPGPFLEEEEAPKDAWGNKFKFEIRNKRIKVLSPGSDGQFDTDDDIVE